VLVGDLLMTVGPHAGEHDALTDVAGLLVGHDQDLRALTGCTVILCPDGAVAGVDVRGQAPGTRETDLCRPGTLVSKVNAVVLCGGSAFGLDAASGVVQWLWERGYGFDTGVTRVPIVPAAVIFDLAIGEVAWPASASGYRACGAANARAVEQGCAGAGAGATVGKVLGPGQAMKSGVGTASQLAGPWMVGALVVVNAFGSVVRPASGESVAGARDPLTECILPAPVYPWLRTPAPSAGTNTTIGVVATDASLSPEQANYLARIAHDGLARTIVPVHTMYDGDTVFALATGAGPAVSDQDVVGLGIAVLGAVEQSVLRAVESAVSMGGLPATRDLVSST